MAVLGQVRARNVDGEGLIYFSSARLVLEWTFQQFIERELARTCSRASTLPRTRNQTGYRKEVLVCSSQPPTAESCQPPMAARIVRLTLFSGPQCSLCEVGIVQHF